MATQSSQDLISDIRSNCLDTYRNQPGRLEGDIGNESENQSNYHGRFIYELIQNADDVLEGRDNRRARFELHEDKMYMAHTGEPFTEEDVRALCILGKSSKSDEHATIGQKGRGFTSVLEITETPKTYSKTIDFQFDREKAYQTVESELDLERSIDSNDVPVLTLPFEPNGRPDRVEELLKDDTPFTTVFEFELRDGRYDTIKTRFSEIDPKIMLFLRRLERLEIEIEGEEMAWQMERASSEDISGSDVQVSRVDIVRDGSVSWAQESTDHKYLKFRSKDIPVEQTEGLEGPQWNEVEYTEVGAALEYEGDGEDLKLKPIDPPPEIHLFLPTDEPSPIPLLINGAFKPDSSRTGIPIVDEEEGYNAFLLDELAELLANNVLDFATRTSTTVDEFLSCITPDEEALSSEAAGYLVDALSEELQDTPFIPKVGDSLESRVSEDRFSLSDLMVPYSHEDARWVGKEIADLYGSGKIPDSLDPQERRFPARELLGEDGVKTLIMYDVDALSPQEIPALLAEAPDTRTNLQAYDDAGLRRKVDPVLDVLIGIESVLSDEDEREKFFDSCQEEAVFPFNVSGESLVERKSTDNVNLLFPPEDFDLSLEFKGVEFLSPDVYRPEGWTRPRGEQGESDDFQSNLMSLWDIEEFDFQAFSRAVILPRLPRARGSIGDSSDLQSEDRLRIVKELASETAANSEKALPYKPRKDNELYRLCMLPVPTKNNGWEYAYKVYFGQEWLEDETPEIASALTIFEDSSKIDPPVLEVPEHVLSDEELEQTDQEEDDEEQGRTAKDEWFEFFRWVGVSYSLRLTPLFNPEEEREYGKTEDLGRTSEKHPTLGGLSQHRWNRFQTDLSGVLDDSAATDRDHVSMFQVNRFEFWDELSDAANRDKSTAVALFCHLNYWWNAKFSEWTKVGVGGHSVKASQVADRSKGVPKSSEEYWIGRNLWLWELRNSKWCPSIHGQYEPTRVWKRTDALINQFQIGGGDVLLPILSNDVEEQLGDPSGELCAALGIRESIASGEFKPKDAKLVCDILAVWADNASNAEIDRALPTLRTAYREIASVMPSRRQGNPPEVWTSSDDELSNTRLICEIGDGEYELQDAGETYYVTSQGERSKIPLKNPPVFILQESEAGAFGTYFGVQQLSNSVESTLDNPESKARGDLTAKTKEFLEERQDSIRCLLLRDRPAQREDDKDKIDRFMEELTVVETLRVSYKLGDSEESAEPSWYITRPGTGQTRRTPYVSLDNDSIPENADPIAKALSEFLDYPNVGDIVLILSARTEEERTQRLDLLDAPHDFLENPETVGKTEGISGLGEDINETEDEGGIEGSGEDVLSSSDGTDTAEKEAESETSETDPDEEIVDVDDLQIKTEGGELIDSLGLSGRNSPGDNNDQGGTSNGGSAKQGGIREALQHAGEEIAYSFECSRLKNKYDVDDPGDYVFIVAEPDDIRRLDRNTTAKPVMDKLRKEHDLDFSFPGFDILSVNPKSRDSMPLYERLIEVKAKKRDGPVSISINEWASASKDGLREDYYLYVVADLGKEVGGSPFVRTVKNPAGILHAEEERETSVSFSVNTKRFREGGEVKETPLHMKE